MSMEQLMAMVPLEAAMSCKQKGRKSRWEKKSNDNGQRWGSEEDKPFLPPPFVDLPIGMTPLQIDRFLREQRLEELQRKLQAGDLEHLNSDVRPPSPPPIYDRNGGRVNTREVRIRTAMQNEMQRLCEFMVDNLEGFVPPPDFKPAKKVRRIEFPHEKYPDYNFMGIIIGPRGCNHKRLEAESGCTISVRGRGTHKEGKRDHQTDEEATMPMHVHIMADTDEQLERAVALIEPLLDPLHPAHEEFKRKGLEQLALVNGVNYGDLDQRRCAICQGVGHLAHECPDNQELQPFKKPQLRCAICGDMGHVTMDCKMRPGGPAGQPSGSAGGPPPPPAMPSKPIDRYKIDMEYQKMMTELSGDGLGSLDPPGAPGGNGAGAPPGSSRSPYPSSPASQGYTPPPGSSPAGDAYSNQSPMNRGSHMGGPPPPPPAMRGHPRPWGPHAGHPAAPMHIPPPDGYWGGHMRGPPMGMMPIPGMPWAMPPPNQQMMGMWGAPFAFPGPMPHMGAWGHAGMTPGAPSAGASGIPDTTQLLASGSAPQNIGASTAPSAPSMPPPPMPGPPEDPDSMECGD